MLFRPNKNNNIDGGRMKKITSIVLIICIIAMTGCTTISRIVTDAKDAIFFAEDFCMILSEDMEEAKKYLHPDSKPSKDELQAFVEEIECVNNISFSDGVAIKGCDAVHSHSKDIKLSVTTFEFSYEIVVGNKIIELFFVVIKDDNGFLISEFYQTNLLESNDKAETHVKDFCNALATSNEEAQKYIHPNSRLIGEKFDSFVAKLEEFNEIDFSSGIEIKECKIVSYTQFALLNGGDEYEYRCQLDVAGKTVKMFFIVSDNDEGYGIYSFGVIE